MTGLLVAIGLVAVWLLLHTKLSRPDGVHIRRIHPYRRMMHFIMPTRNESVVYYDTHANADKLLEYIEKARERFQDLEVDVTHCLVAAVALGVAENPEMNRFVVGRRLYQRKGEFITFSMKRKRLNKRAKLAAVKMRMEPGQTFADLLKRINENIRVERSDTVTYADKELGTLSKIPRPFLRFGVSLFRWMDYFNILPGSFIENDAMYTSVFIANLGSVRMAPGYHHLYEWGTCPLFMMVGKIEERPFVEDGQVVIRRVIPIRWTYDERIDDGLTSSYGIAAVNRALEDPFTYLGCLDEKGSDARPLDKDRPGPA